MSALSLHIESTDSDTSENVFIALGLGTRTLFGNFFGNNKHLNYARIMGREIKSRDLRVGCMYTVNNLALCSDH